MTQRILLTSAFAMLLFSTGYGEGYGEEAYNESTGVVAVEVENTAFFL